MKLNYLKELVLKLWQRQSILDGNKTDDNKKTTINTYSPYLLNSLDKPVI